MINVGNITELTKILFFTLHLKCWKQCTHKYYISIISSSRIILHLHLRFSSGELVFIALASFYNAF